MIESVIAQIIFSFFPRKHFEGRNIFPYSIDVDLGCVTCLRQWNVRNMSKGLTCTSILGFVLLLFCFYQGKNIPQVAATSSAAASK